MLDTFLLSALVTEEFRYIFLLPFELEAYSNHTMDQIIKLNPLNLLTLKSNSKGPTLLHLQSQCYFLDLNLYIDFVFSDIKQLI